MANSRRPRKQKVLTLPAVGKPKFDAPVQYPTGLPQPGIAPPVPQGERAMLLDAPPQLASQIAGGRYQAPRNTTMDTVPSQGEIGGLDDLFAKRTALNQARELYPSAKVSRTEGGWDIAPPEKPSRFKTFLKGMGYGAQLGAKGGLGGMIGGALTGGIGGAIKPKLVDEYGKDLSIDETDTQIGSQLAQETKQAAIANQQAQTLERRANAATNLRFPNTRARETVFPGGGKGTIEMNPDSPTGWSTVQVPGAKNNIITAADVPPLGSVEINGQRVDNLNPGQQATALAARGRSEQSDREFAWQQRKFEAERQDKAAQAAAENNQWDQAITLTSALGEMYNVDAATERANVERLGTELAEINRNAKAAGIAADDVQYTADRKAKENEIATAQDRANYAARKATDSADRLAEYQGRGAGSAGRSVRPAKLKGPESGLFPRYKD